ncbi:DHA2 family efflux MFS transporter permease subunit [Paenibacillus oralis]|uniref:DHA2 family efflux MFS transporter permease subunit n=1 Tax=Paenibacillus oralis TaxID=2490856 RepID=A0A3P3U789_9BACL|nr:MDR family MFS transporter [Paenibacillus oralis]RRJ64373.1 DHA2 family efflux MFS transporter permease subunit [Paenibacillus oralis]
MTAEKKNQTTLILVGLMLAILMSAMDNTIVTTAMGTIVADLGGMEQFVWVTSAYMVAVMAGTPIFGKLSDMYGRKRFFLFGVVTFLLGSVLCGLAGSIMQLSIYRAIQGIGGGALMPIAFTIIYDIFPVEQRGKMTGLLGAVFGTSSIFGPLLGAFITDSLGWHWVFYINVPIGIVSLLLISAYYRESLTHTKQQIDWSGAVTLVGAVVCLMFALELGGEKFAWGSAAIIALFAGFAVLFVAFLLAERKAREPIISFDMFKIRLYATSCLLALLYGSVFIVATVYIPIFVQGVFGGSATNSGIILMPMMIGSVIGSMLGGMLTSRMSYRAVMAISVVCFVCGVFALSTLTNDTSRLLLTVFSILTGFGVGFSFSVLSMASVHHFDMRQRGAATSTNSFLRSLGMTLGITIFGIVQRNLLADKMSAAFAGTGQAGATFGNAQEALSEDKRAMIPPEILDKITDALSSSIAHTFMWALIPAVCSVLVVIAMPKDRILRGAAAKPSKQQG